jgi:hypothetical protein
LTFSEGQASAPSAKYDPALSTLIQREVTWIQTGILQGFARCGESEGNRSGYVLPIFGIELRLPIEALDLGSNLYR